MRYLSNLGKQIFKTFMVASIIDMVLAIILQSIGVAVMSLILVNIAMLGECITAASKNTILEQQRAISNLIDGFSGRKEEKKDVSIKNNDNNTADSDDSILVNDFVNDPRERTTLESVVHIIMFITLISAVFHMWI